MKICIIGSRPAELCFATRMKCESPADNDGLFERGSRDARGVRHFFVARWNFCAPTIRLVAIC